MGSGGKMRGTGSGGIRKYARIGGRGGRWVNGRVGMEVAYLGIVCEGGICCRGIGLVACIGDCHSTDLRQIVL